MKLKIAIYSLTILGVISLGYTYELKINTQYLKDYFDTLLSVSSMVFTIMGIWIAFLYPNALLKLVNPQKIGNADFSDSLKDTKRLESIVASVLKSATVVASIMVINLVKLSISESQAYAANSQIFNNIAFSLALSLTILQFEAILSVVLSNIAFINELHSRREDRQLDQEI